MANNLTAHEVIQIKDALKNDSGYAALRRDVERRHEQHAMTDVPWLPDWMTRQWDKVNMNSADVMQTAQRVIADMASYARIAWKSDCNLREAATRDIEWDGETLEALDA